MKIGLLGPTETFDPTYVDRTFNPNSISKQHKIIY